MTRTRRILAPAAAALAIGAGLVGMAPAQADDSVPAAPKSSSVVPADTTGSSAQGAASASENSSEQATPQGPLVLVRSATDHSTYYLKGQTATGGDAPAPDGTYAVDVASGNQQEHFDVQSHDGTLDLSRSDIIKSSAYEPNVSVTWIG